ncbi:MAG: sensor histidine kinase [Thermomicrobiales bacterium]
MKTKTLPIHLWLGMALLLVVGMPVVAMSVVAALSVRETTQGALGIEAVRESVTGNVARWSDPAWQQQIRAQLVTANTDVVLVNSAGQEVYRSAPDPLASPTGIPGVVQYMSTGNQPLPSLPDQLPPLQGKGIVVSSNLIRPFTALAVTDGGQRVGTAQFFVGRGEPFATQLLPLNPFRKWLLALAGPSGLHMAFAGLIALVSTAALMAWFLGRTLLRPLAATSRAARQIAAGDLEFTLPASHVLEVAEVGAAFRTMGDALRASLREQEVVEQERRFFIAAIVHDLRTPLFSLRGYLDGLAAGLAETPAKAATYLTICRKKAAMLDRLVSDLFAYARMEYLDQPLQTAPVDVGTLLRAAVEGVQPQVAEKEITLSCDGPPIPCLIEADGHLITRAVENLLDNALRYTPAGGTIRVSWREEPSGITFTVADSGPGIPPDDLPHLFAPLFRGETSRNRTTGGVGLGLTIARRILRAHGGDLTAANAPQGGACFVASMMHSA